MAKKIDKQRGERFRYLREEVLDISQDQFAERVGVERGAVGNWELGHGIKTENLTRVASEFRVALDWLAYGRGQEPRGRDRHISSEEVAAGLSNDNAPADNAFARDQYTPRNPGGLPELDAALGAGDGRLGEVLALPIGPESYSGHRVVNEWLLPEPFIRNEARASINSTIVLPVTGDSMLPSYNYGDRVLVDLAQNTLMQDGVYAISDGQTEPRIKRLQSVFNSSPRRVRIISDNTIYATEEHLLSDVTIIGRVCGIIARR